MGLNDPKLVSVHVSFDVLACAICAWPFKGELVLLCCSSVKQLLSFKVHLSINSQGAMAGSILSLTTDNMYIIVFPGFWMYYPMIHKQELLITASAASVDSLSM